MERVSSKNFILWTIAIIVVIISIVGLSFAFLNYSRTSTTQATIEAGEVMLGYIEQTNGISLENALPVTDEAALNTTDTNAYFDFYVTYSFPATVSLKYEIDILNNTSNLEGVQNGTLSSLLTSRVKVALENRTEVMPEEPLLVSPTYFSLLETKPASNSKAGYKLYEKTVTGKSVDYYRLYMWIPEYDASGVGIPLIDVDSVAGIQNQAFSVKISVQANGKVSE